MLKRTVNQPGTVNDEFAAVRETAEQTVTPGMLNVLNADLHIRKGQYIGLVGSGDTELSSGGAAGANSLQWNPPLVVGAGGEHATFSQGTDYMLFNATVKRP